MPLPDTETPTEVKDVSPLSPEDAAFTASFVQRYELAIKNWLKTHPNIQLPITYHPVTGLPRWVNRAERRRIEKMNPNKIQILLNHNR